MQVDLIYLSLYRIHTEYWKITNISSVITVSLESFSKSEKYPKMTLLLAAAITIHWQNGYVQFTGSLPIYINIITQNLKRLFTSL